GRVVRLPACERVAASLEQPVEPLDVELARGERQAVARAVCLDPPGAKGLAQAVDVDLQRLDGRARGLLAPERVDQPVPGVDFVRIQKENGEQGALLRRSQG